MEVNNQKVPRFYYLAAILFVAITIIELLNIDSEGHILISLPFYENYVSPIGITLCNVYIYNLSIYGLLRNKTWGLISAIFVSLFGFSINIRYLDIRSLLFLFIFIGLLSVVIKKASKELNE